MVQLFQGIYQHLGAEVACWIFFFPDEIIDGFISTFVRQCIEFHDSRHQDGIGDPMSHVEVGTDRVAHGVDIS